jgi:hypothetical protein
MNSWTKRQQFYASGKWYIKGLKMIRVCTRVQKNKCGLSISMGACSKKLIAESPFTSNANNCTGFPAGNQFCDL